MNDEPNLPPQDEQLLRWIDRSLPEDQLKALDLSATPAWHEQRAASQLTGNLLRSSLPRTVELPSPDLFTSRIMEAVQRDAPATAPASNITPFPSRFRQWFAPLASAALVAAGFLLWNANPHPRSSPVAETYTPDSRVIARAYFSDDADATVIDLENLEAVPDSREIRAFNIASADPAAPGEPQIFYAANGTRKPVVVLSHDAASAPHLRAIP
jgi:hypothetical protein